MNLILGIDPGLHHTGWGIVGSYNSNLTYVASGKVTTNPVDPIAVRLLYIHDQLLKVISEHKPAECAIEETFVNKNPLSSLKLGHARGTIILSLAKANLRVSEYASTLVKKSLVGSGRAEKDQVMFMINRLLPNAKVSDPDTADALAVAICHINHKKMKL